MEADPNSAPDELEFEVPFRRLRQPATINLFKLGVLGESHVPGEHQANQVMQAFAEAGLADGLDARTWKGWFGPSARRARSDGVMALDRFVDVERDRRRNQFPDAAPTSQFFKALLDGGLAKQLLAPTEAKQPATALAQRALEYEPLSAIHLHFDAIEAVAMSDGNGVVRWEEIKALASRRIMELLHQRWSPRHGTVYSELTPTLELKLLEADAAEQDRIAQRYERMKGGLFEIHKNLPPQPSWRTVGVSSDIPAEHAHKLLLALCADDEFLVADRFENWVLDFVSAGLAMHAAAWSDRYQTHGASFTPEMIIWRAIALLFFSDEPQEVVRDGLIAALEESSGGVTDEALELLHRAGRWYRRWLSDLGLEWPLIAKTVHRCWRVLGIEYKG